MSAAIEPCRLLQWDSDFFGIRIARVCGDLLTAESVVAVEQWCMQQKVQCLYFQARSDDAATVALAERNNYHLVDVRLTLEHPLQAPAGVLQTSESSLRPARDSDVSELRRIARLSHTDTRFFFDERFARERCEALYETWIQSSCEGFAQAVLVNDEDGVHGYVTCHLTEDRADGSIGLIAVDAEQQGKGLGGRLVREALSWFAKQKVRRVSVVTQGRNIAAQRLYARSGFIPRKLELYYHRWF